MQPFIHADWYYDDRRQVGLDFSDEAQAETYDARQGGSGDADRALLKRLGLKPHHAMADIGCGTGILACEAAFMCDQAIGIDISEAMLSRARARAASMGAHRVRFVEASFLSFDLADESVDLVTTKNALHHLPDFWKGIALSRIARALKPGGRLYLRDVSFPCHPRDAPALVEGWAAFMAANTGYSREDVATHVRDEHSTYGWVMEGLIERSGFTLLSADYPNDVYGTYVAEKPS